MSELSDKLVHMAELHTLAAQRCYDMASDAEELEGIRDGISHPAGCMFADMGDGDPMWFAVPGCKLDHDGKHGGLSLSAKERKRRV